MVLNFFKKLIKKDEGIKIIPKFEKERIIFKILEGNKEIFLDKFDDVNKLRNFIEKDTFDITEDKKNIALDYENVYQLSESERNFFKLPLIIETYVYVNTDGFFGSKGGLKYKYAITDGKDQYEILAGNYIKNKETNEKYFLNKTQYELIDLIEKYNKDTHENKEFDKQYIMLQKIKDISEKTNILLDKGLKEKEELLIIENIELDFMENEDGLIEVVPFSSDLDKEQNKNLKAAFRRAKISQNFYEINLNNKKIKVVLNPIIKKDLKIVKKHHSTMTKTEFLSRTSPIF